MKKVFKVVSIIAIIIATLIGLVIGGVFAIQGVKTLKRRNDRINNSKTLSKYIEYHGWEYLGGTFEALEFHAEDIKCDLLKEKNISYFNDNFMGDILILDDYTIYETAFNSDKTYSNGQQYKQIQPELKIKRIQIQNDTIYLVGEDNKYYVFSYEEIKEMNKTSNGTELSFIKNENIKNIKVHHKKTNPVANTTSYFVLKNDGQIYEIDYERKYNSKIGQVENIVLKETLLYSNKDFGNIKDFNTQYIENYNDITRIVSDKGLFYLKQTNNQEYIDTEPAYEMVASDIYNKYKSDIKYIDANYVFTTDNNIIRTDMLCREIDKEVLSKSEIAELASDKK